MRPINGPERKATQDTSAEGKWKEFSSKIRIRGESKALQPDHEPSDPLAGYSDEERAGIITKLNCLRHEYIVPRMMRSVIDQVFYVVEGARFNLRGESHSPEWCASVAIEMYRFYTALEAAARSAREVEQATGFSGERLSTE